MDDQGRSQERVSEVDLMSGNYRSSLLRRIERQWVELLEKVSGKIVVAVERTLQRSLNHDGILIPVPVRTVADRRRLDRFRRRD